MWPGCSHWHKVTQICRCLTCPWLLDSSTIHTESQCWELLCGHTLEVEVAAQNIRVVLWCQKILSEEEEAIY